MVKALDMVLLDVYAIFHADCIEHSDFEHKLMLTTLTPLGLTGLTLCFQGARAAVWRADMAEGNVLNGMLMILYFLLPTTSTVIFSSFTCTSFNNGDEDVSFMRADYSIACGGAKHKAVHALAVSMALVFPLGVPLLMLALLAQRRHQISSRTTRRGDSKELGTISFLFRNFAPEYW